MNRQEADMWAGRAAAPVDHSRDVPPHTHGGTDAPECTTCKPAVRNNDTAVGPDAPEYAKALERRVDALERELEELRKNLDTLDSKASYAYAMVAPIA